MNYQEALQGLKGITPCLAKNPNYDPLRPKRRDAKPYVKNTLERLGYTQENLRRLNVIHVAGTKGKGTTCRLISAFLEAHHDRRGVPVKVCTLTGPHLLSCTERIQINGTPITQEAFAESFFQVVAAANRPPVRGDGPRMTQLVALIAINYAARQGVDFFVCEAFCGGLFDATNVFDSPAITAITKLGMDHVHLLGPSLADITRNKAGIMREHTICVTCEQSPEAFEVLMEHSNRLSAPLDDITDDDHSSDAIAALPTVAHRTNAAIALKVVAHLLHTDDLDQRLGAFDEQDVIQGLQRYKSPGSFREITKSRFHFLLDTAHNTLSLPVALEWFFEKAVSKEDEYASRGFKAVIYSHSAKLEGKESFDLVLDSLRRESEQVDLLIISSLVGRADGTYAAERLNVKAEMSTDALDELRRLALRKGWLDACVQVASSVEQALEVAENAYKQSGDRSHMSCLVTGSSYLVAEALAVLEA